jgi:hypothetical protein
MSSDRDTTRIVRSWLDEGVTALPDRVLDAVLDQVPTTQQRRPLWPARRFAEMSTFAKLATAAAAFAVLVVVGVTFMLGGRGVGVESTATPSPTVPNSSGTAPGPTATASGDAAASVPGEFTACVPGNSLLREGTGEEIVVPHPDGDMTMHRQRGDTWVGTITATDARFSGRHYYSFEANAYTLASGDELGTFAEGHRIENDDGAWQGSATGANLPDGTFGASPVFLTGEGAYEGLTAVLFATEGSCFFDFRGVIMEFPDPPPVPYTGE